MTEPEDEFPSFAVTLLLALAYMFVMGAGFGAICVSLFR